MTNKVSVLGTADKTPKSLNPRRKYSITTVTSYDTVPTDTDAANLLVTNTDVVDAEAPDSRDGPIHSTTDVFVVSDANSTINTLLNPTSPSHPNEGTDALASSNVPPTSEKAEHALEKTEHSFETYLQFTRSSMLKYMLIISGIFMVYMIIWIVASPPKRIIQFSATSSRYEMCDSSKSVFQYIFAVLKYSLIIFGSVIAQRTEVKVSRLENMKDNTISARDKRNYRRMILCIFSQVNESAKAIYIYMCTELCRLFLMFVTLDPNNDFIARSSLTLYSTTIVLGITFWKKIYNAFTKFDVSTDDGQSSTPANSPVTIVNKPITKDNESTSKPKGKLVSMLFKSKQGKVASAPKYETFQ